MAQQSVAFSCWCLPGRRRTPPNLNGTRGLGKSWRLTAEHSLPAGRAASRLVPDQGLGQRAAGSPHYPEGQPGALQSTQLAQQNFQGLAVLGCVGVSVAGSCILLGSGNCNTLGVPEAHWRDSDLGGSEPPRQRAGGRMAGCGIWVDKVDPCPW